MVEIRRLDIKKGDNTTVCTLEQATKEVTKAIDKGYLVIDETTTEKRMLQNALGLSEESKVAFYPPVGGG